MRRSFAVVVALVAGAIAPATGVLASPRPQAQPAGVGIRLAEAPKDRADDPRARLYIVDHLAPGATISRKVEVSNSTDRPVRVSLYAAAASVTDGQFRFGEGRAVNDVSTWTTVEPDEVDVRPRTPVTATVRIRVPADAPAGERYGVVWAELPASSGGNVTAVNRVGVRVYLSVGPGGEPASDFAIDTLTAKRSPSGDPLVAATVRNTGGRAIDMSGELKLENGPAGLTAGPFEARLGATLGRGETQPVEVPLSQQIPDGPWDAKLTLKSGVVERSVAARITFPAAPDASSAPVDADPERSSPAPLLLLLAVAAIVALLAALAVTRRRASSARGSSPA